MACLGAAKKKKMYYPTCSVVGWRRIFEPNYEDRE